MVREEDQAAHRQMAGRLQLVVAWVGSEAYAFEIQHVREITPKPRVTFVPGAPSGVLGVMELRGHVIPVLGLGQRLGLTAASNGSETRTIVIEVAERPLGVLVDRVTEIITVSGDDVQPVPRQHRRPCVAGAVECAGQEVLLLDTAALAPDPGPHARRNSRRRRTAAA